MTLNGSRVAPAIHELTEVGSESSFLEDSVVGATVSHTLDHAPKVK